MKKNSFGSFIVIIIMLLLGFMLFLGRAKAQTANPWQVGVTGLHTACTVIASTTQYCFASDGLYVSLNGAAYTQIGAATAAGVTSWNGQTGVVTYTPPADLVTSVNGKVGAVTIAATTTLQ